MRRWTHIVTVVALFAPGTVSAGVNASSVSGDPRIKVAAGPSAPARVSAPATTPERPAARSDDARTLAPLVPTELRLRSPAVAVPLRLIIPALGVDAAMLGVGVTSTNVMDAPMRPGDWPRAFWYRGGGIPGDPGTATIAGHRSGGANSVFANLDRIASGDVILVRDVRVHRNIRFVVGSTRTYPLEGLDAAALTRIYGAGPATGRRALAAEGGGSHLTLITCIGELAGSGYSHRLVVHAERVT